MIPNAFKPKSPAQRSLQGTAMTYGGTSVVLQIKTGKLGVLGTYGELATRKDMTLEDCHWTDPDESQD
ncbi:unnamed protein product [Fusarium graminearum]|uniref:Chromosome 1, complete genome n=2 Tax=Gibberella zeae TaxID=5518 RepID=A0A098DAR8_GIBZE|nr:unnamed protein product [Fusarium graminearum]CAF3455692.1 unnamed protein product [Fusarium graminearum]CAF3583942.1 unnamed protein product [Fusarium graminearum]CAG1961068.1 unnamed protein product [Fusarium graminearum]CAG1972595.1 unnamed protein product [Fusarium graminearum]